MAAITPHRHLTTDNTTYNTVWLDAMHDRTNYRATQATTDEDLLMEVNRLWPPPTAQNTFLELFKDKYILEPKINVISAIPGEMKIKDVYSGLFFGFALNEFIDQADTSTLNYLKYYESIHGPLAPPPKKNAPPPPFTGLPDSKFPNSFLYNCDIILFKYFITLREEEEEEGIPPPRKYPYYDAENVDTGPMQDPPEVTDWDIANCKKRHVYNLNCFWKELLNTIDSDHSHVLGDGEYNFDPTTKDEAIKCLRNIEFTDFEMIKKTTSPTTYVDLLYQYPKWKIRDGDDKVYYYVTTQSLCASNIPIDSNNVKPRPEGKTTKEQKSCFKGLKKLANSPPPLGLDNDNAKSHFFMLLKYAGDTSHMVLYDILNSINSIDESIDTTNLALHLSERPLLVRTFAKNMNVYCKYLAKFNNKRIIKTPNEVFKLTSDTPEKHDYMRAKNYTEDIDKLRTLLVSEDTLTVDTDILRLTVLIDDIEQHLTINQIEQYLTNPNPPALSQDNKDKIKTNHNFIKQILSLSQLIDKTDDFVKDIQHVNDKIINRKFFPGSYRCPTLTNLKTFISSMINNAINQKNKQKFYRAIEYLHTFKSIIVPLKQEGDLLYQVFELKMSRLKLKIIPYDRKFKRLTVISITRGGRDTPTTEQIRDLDDEPHSLLNWIEDAFTSDSPRSNKSTAIGIQNIVDYLIMYDILIREVLEKQAPTLPSGAGGGGQQKTGGGNGSSAAEEMPVAEDGGGDESWWEFIGLDKELEKQEVDELEKQQVKIFRKLLHPIDSLIDRIVEIENYEVEDDNPDVILEITSDINDNIREITREITSSINGIVDVDFDPDGAIYTDFLEALYYILIQFTYFYELNPNPPNPKIKQNNKHVTQIQLQPYTIVEILNTAAKVITKAQASPVVVEVMASVASVRTGALVLPQPPQMNQELSDAVAAAAAEAEAASVKIQALVRGNKGRSEAAAKKAAAEKAAAEKAAAEKAAAAAALAVVNIQSRVRGNKGRRVAAKKATAKKAAAAAALAVVNIQSRVRGNKGRRVAAKKVAAKKEAAKKAATKKRNLNAAGAEHDKENETPAEETPDNKRAKSKTEGMDPLWAKKFVSDYKETLDAAAEEEKKIEGMDPLWAMIYSSNIDTTNLKAAEEEEEYHERQQRQKLNNIKHFSNKVIKETTPTNQSTSNKRGLENFSYLQPNKRLRSVRGGAKKTRKKTKSSKLRKTIKKRILKKIKRKSLRRKKPIKKRVHSKNRKVKQNIKNKTRKYKKPKKQKRSRKPKPKPKP